jgi:hypothetical protein
MNTTSNSIDVSAAQGAASRAATDTSRWLVSRSFDAAVLVGALILSLALYTSARAGAALAVAGALFAMITDMPHVVQTSIRIGLDPRERALHGRRYVISFGLITLLTFGLFATDHRPIVAMIWIVWQFLHVVKQHYGIVRIYAAKNQYRGPTRLMAVTLALGCASPVLYRVGQGMRFNEYYVLGQRMPFSGLGLPEIPVPAPLVWAMYAGFACAALLFAGEQLGRLRRGENSLPLVAHLTLLLAIVSYNLSYLFVSDLYALIMIATAVHSLQYHAISWRRNHGRYAQGRGQLSQPTLLEMLSRRENVLTYAALSLVIGATIASTETLWLGFIPFVVVLHHFYMDGYVWKSALNPTLGADLGIPSRRATVAQGAA